MNRILILLFGMFACAVCLAQSANDGFHTTVGGTIDAILVQPDGAIVVGGQFDSINSVARNNLARLQPNGATDSTLVDSGMVTGNIAALARQPDGKIIVARSNNIARINVDGTLDPSFVNPNPNGIIFSVVLQSDGKILLGGYFTTLGGRSQNHVGRLNSDGSADATFADAGADDVITGISLQKDGRILIAGAFTEISGVNQEYVARLHNDGTLDTTFRPLLNAAASTVLVRPDGKIVVGGYFTDNGGSGCSFLVALQSSGARDESTNCPTPDNGVLTLALQADGKVLAGGYFSDVGESHHRGLIRLNADLSIDSSFADAHLDAVAAIALQQDNKIVVAGGFVDRIKRLNPDGTEDSTLGNLQVNGAANTAAVEPDGRILLGGSFTLVQGQSRANMARIRTDGTLDNALAPADWYVNCFAVQDDGKILVGGAFTAISAEPRHSLARLNADGTLDTGFADLGLNQPVDAILLQPDGKILVGGEFTEVGGATQYSIVRLNTDGALDASFQNAGFNFYGVYGLALQWDGKIVLGTGAGLVYRLNTDGSIDWTFASPRADGNVGPLSVASDGKILVGGGFRHLDNVVRNRLARLNYDGSLDPDFPDVGANERIESMTTLADGRLLIAGDFTQIAGGIRHYLARLELDGTLDSTFADVYADQYVAGLAVQKDGRIIAVGAFTEVEGVSRNAVVRLSTAAAAEQSLSFSGNVLTWLRGGISPDLQAAELLTSVDGVSYAAAGIMERVAGGWQSGATVVPDGSYVQVRGIMQSGQGNGSMSIIQERAQFFVDDIFTSGFEP